MPIIVTACLSKKLSKDFQSQGFSLSIQSELPAAAIEDPNAMAKATSHLFQLTSDLLEAEVQKARGQSPAPSAATVHGRGGTIPAPSPIAHQPTKRFERSGGNGQGNGNRPHRGITDAQINAIKKMAQKINQDAESMCHGEYGISLSELTIRQASQLIDTLKQQIEAPVGAA